MLELFFFIFLWLNFFFIFFFLVTFRLKLSYNMFSMAFGAFWVVIGVGFEWSWFLIDQCIEILVDFLSCFWGYNSFAALPFNVFAWMFWMNILCIRVDYRRIIFLRRKVVWSIFWLDIWIFLEGNFFNWWLRACFFSNYCLRFWWIWLLYYWSYWFDNLFWRFNFRRLFLFFCDFFFLWRRRSR